MKLGQEPRGIGGIGAGVEHVLNRAELFAVPPEIDLETADIKAARAAIVLLEHIGQRLIATIEPVPLPFHVHGPGPGAGLAPLPASGFGLRNRDQN